MGFSEKGLIEQLSSEFGSGFARADAEFAVKHLAPDWNKQAEMAAKGYLESGMGFSRNNLIKQLSSDYGNKFTKAQAEHAADAVGL